MLNTKDYTALNHFDEFPTAPCSRRPCEIVLQSASMAQAHSVDELRSLLRQHFKLDDFRVGQRAAIEHVIAGRHTLVVMPTGSGKSLIFQVCALAMPGTALVISPLIALMKDQVDRLQQLGVAATFINSSLSSQEQARRLDKMARGDWKLVYIAPERLRSRPSSTRSGRCKFRCSPSMRRIASRNGDTIFAPITCTSARRARRSTIPSR